MSDKFAFSTDVDATTKREAFDEGRAYERGAADERERIIAEVLSAGEEWLKVFDKPDPVAQAGRTTLSGFLTYIGHNTRKGEGEK